MSDDLIWRERGKWIPLDPDGKQAIEGRKRIHARHMAAEDVERLRVNRDPCQKCGVRADVHAQYGCGR